MTIYIGLDIHASKTVLFCTNSDGEVLLKNAIGTRENQVVNLARRLLKMDSHVVAGFETGTQSEWMYKILKREGIDARMIPAQYVYAYSKLKKQKNDMNDAQTMCHGIRTGVFTSFVHVPPELIKKLRKILSMRSHFVDLVVAEINVIKALFRSDGIQIKKTLKTDKSWNELMEMEEAKEHLEEIKMHFAVFKALTVNIRELEKKIEQTIKEEYQHWYDLLITIPGVGLITAATIIATISDISRFKSSHHFASYCGIIPSTFDSGTKKVNGHITRNGSPLIRKYVCEAAQKARSRTNPFSFFYYDILNRRGHKNIAVVAVCHRILRVAFQMLKTQTPFDPAKMGIFEQQDKHGEVRWVRRNPPAKNPVAETIKREQIQKNNSYTTYEERDSGALFLDVQKETDLEELSVLKEN